MKHNMKFVLGILTALILATGLASAETSTQTKTFDFGSGVRNLTFNLLDTAFGHSVQLSDITAITVTAIINQADGVQPASVGATNLSDTITTSVISAVWTGSGWFTSSNVTLAFAGTSGSPNYSNTNDHGAFEIAPLDVWSAPITSGSTPTLGGEVNSSYYSEYAGSGTFVISMNAFQNFTFIGDGSFQQNYTSSRFTGNVTVTYEVVPEPSTLALFGAAVTGVLVWHRRKKSVSQA